MSDLNKLNGAVLDSREVAEMLGKTHFHLMRDIKRYTVDLTSEGGISKIGLSGYWRVYAYTNEQNGRIYNRYDITRKGCEFLAHKLTGKKGAIFTARYIDRFHDMEQTIVNAGLQTDVSKHGAIDASGFGWVMDTFFKGISS